MVTVMVLETTCFDVGILEVARGGAYVQPLNVPTGIEDYDICNYFVDRLW